MQNEKILKINFYAQARFPCASASQFAAQAGSPEVNSRDYIIVGSKWSREEEHGSSNHEKFPTPQGVKFVNISLMVLPVAAVFILFAASAGTGIVAAHLFLFDDGRLLARVVWRKRRRPHSQV